LNKINWKGKPFARLINTAAKDEMSSNINEPTSWSSANDDDIILRTRCCAEAAQTHTTSCALSGKAQHLSMTMETWILNLQQRNAGKNSAASEQTAKRGKTTDALSGDVFQVIKGSIDFRRRNDVGERYRRGRIRPPPKKRGLLRNREGP